MFSSYYNSLDEIPIKPFSQCLNGDLTKVSKGKFFNAKGLESAWEKLFNDHIEKNGLPEDYLEYMEKQIKALEYYDRAYNGKKWEIVRARVYEAEAREMLGGQTEDIDSSCAKLTRILKLNFPIRSTECSANEYYAYLRQAKEN